jgi:hypothetical protein
VGGRLISSGGFRGLLLQEPFRFWGMSAKKKLIAKESLFVCVCGRKMEKELERERERERERKRKRERERGLGFRA